MDRRTISTGLIGLIFLAGCGERPEAVYAEWLRMPQEAPASGGRFDAYDKAGELAEQAAPKYLTTVWFTPGKREACLKLVGPALKVLADGSTRPELGYRFTPALPFEKRDRVAGWRLLGRGLVWKIEQSVKKGDLDHASKCAVLATQFGLDLIGGSAMEASLGMVIADEARRSIAPALGRMTPEQLDRLVGGLSGVIGRRPKLAETIAHERLNMLAGVQTLQDAYRDGAWSQLTKTMGPDVRGAVDRLKQMRDGEPAEAAKYFKGLADEGELEARQVAQLAELPTAERAAIPEPELATSRPWKRFARHFFGTLRPLLRQYDETLARTRLLVLEARLQKGALAGGRYPKDLSAWPAEITTDPYTGRAFAYRADGGDCRVYSVGSDLNDDGGQTDEGFASPDLRLELR